MATCKTSLWSSAFTSAISGLVDFDPKKDIKSLEEKVILVTGGTSGIGTETINHLAYHNPSHIYFTGRNATAGTSLVSTLTSNFPKTKFTFIQLDLASLSSVKTSIAKSFTATRLDILILNAGIMASPPSLSKDGYEIQFATNHLGHAMLFKSVLHTLLSTVTSHPTTPTPDVRVITLSSLGYGLAPSAGIPFQALETGDTQPSWLLGNWQRYGASKLANILFSSEVARRYPSLTAATVHPGVVSTPLVATIGFWDRMFVNISQIVLMKKWLTPEEGARNTVWAAASAEREALRGREGGLWLPIGVDGWEGLQERARDVELASRLWEWTEEVLEKF